MTTASDTYHAAEDAMGIPPVSERGRHNQNPEGIGFWALVAEDFATHERRLFEQGFWAVFVHRFGNWRMGQPRIIRAPATLLYRILFKLVEWFCGISLWYTVKLGRRVRIWHHSGMSLGARAIGDDAQIRQNTTLGVAQTGQNDQLPIIAAGADIGAGACIAGAVYVGRDAKIGANALVLTDVPDGATAMGNPAQIFGAPQPATAPEVQAPPKQTGAARQPEEPMRGAPRDMGTVALLGSANLDYLAMSVTAQSERFGLITETYVPPFGQAQTMLLQPAGTSPLEEALSGPLTATLIAERAEDLLGGVYTAPLSLRVEDRDAWLDEALAPLLQLVRSARDRLTGPVFVLSLFALTRSSLGQADGRSDQGLTALIAAANDRIAAALKDMTDVHLLDGAAMLADVGRTAADPGQFWHMGRVPFSADFSDHLARRLLGGLLALRGATARILVLDLDNTLWGGVLGEDGMEGLDIGGAYPGSAYAAFQRALLALNQRGTALAVASKNDEDLALQMMAEHPEMVLRPDDLVTHRISWNEKATGIADMLDEVGLGAANAMFIDDNPVERAKVRRNLPDCIVPDFPAAPEDLERWLLDNPYLDSLELTGSDLKRSAQYKVRAREKVARRSFENVTDFYRDLGMQLTFEPYGPANQKRVLQLFVKTNQFNSTLRRHDAGAVQAILEEGGEVFAVGIADRHSPYELMGVLVLRPDGAMKAAWPDDAAVQATGGDGTWWVDSFLLSCRILGRTVETAVVAWASARIAEKGGTELIGQIIEGPRNTPVRDVFARAGMTARDVAADQGAGGLFVHDAGQGALEVPDYFTVGDTPPAAAAAAASAPARPKAPARAAAPVLPAAAPVAAPGAALPPQSEAQLAATFRRLFSLEEAHDLEQATMDSVPAWDSLAHLKLAMEVDQSMGVRLAGAQLGGISSYPQLRAAVAQAL